MFHNNKFKFQVIINKKSGTLSLNEVNSALINLSALISSFF